MRSVELNRTGHVESPAKDAQSTWTKFVADDSGATSIEYALIGGLVGIGIIASVTEVGTAIANFFIGSPAWFISEGA